MERHYTWTLEDPIDPRSHEPTHRLADEALYEAVDSCVDLALYMLDTRKGREFLGEVGLKAIKQWKPTQHVYRRPLAEMGNYVQDFLNQLRTEPVPVRLMAAQPAIADFRMTSWYTKGEREAAAWRPKSAGTLCLSTIVCILSISPQLLARTFA
jgi:hypothetical protein